MPRKKGDLPGRYVPPHVRKWPNRPNEYVGVAEYQERVDPVPSPVESLPRQGELELIVEKGGSEDNETRNSGQE